MSGPTASGTWRETDCGLGLVIGACGLGVVGVEETRVVSGPVCARLCVDYKVTFLACPMGLIIR
jgi:hypothetical protein